MQANNQELKKLQHIRSFVLREGKMTRAQLRALKELLPSYGLNICAHKVLDFTHIFQDHNPCVVLDIGFGMGDALLAMAEANPTQKFIGIEVYRPGIGSLLQKLHQAQLTNLRIIYHDAVEVMRHHVTTASLNRVQIFFPDPWPKRRHHKRRLIQPEFLNLLATKVKPGGILHIATDWEDYAKYCIKALQTVAEWKNLAQVGDFVMRPKWRPLTKFEVRGQKLQHKAWDIMVEKV